KVLSWVNMKVPEGNDYLEFMLYDQKPDLKSLGTLHHICLEVPDIEKSKAVLEDRPARASHTRPLEIRTGVNRKRQMNLYDAGGSHLVHQYRYRRGGAYPIQQRRKLLFVVPDSRQLPHRGGEGRLQETGAEPRHAQRQ